MKAEVKCTPMEDLRNSVRRFISASNKILRRIIEIQAGITGFKYRISYYEINLGLFKDIRSKPKLGHTDIYYDLSVRWFLGDGTRVPDQYDLIGSYTKHTSFPCEYLSTPNWEQEYIKEMMVKLKVVKFNGEHVKDSQRVHYDANNIPFYPDGRVVK